MNEGPSRRNVRAGLALGLSGGRTTLSRACAVSSPDFPSTVEKLAGP